MSEEEKEAIEELIKKATFCDYELREYPNMICFKKDVITVLNLIERQKEEKDLLTKMNKKLIDESISKNKVKELKKEKIKILEREKGNQDFIMEDTLISQISVLDELLENEE